MLDVCRQVSEKHGARAPCARPSQGLPPGAQEERLEVADSAALKPVFYICHSVTRASPLWGKGREDLLAERGLLALTVVATDDQARAQGLPTLLHGVCLSAEACTSSCSLCLNIPAAAGAELCLPGDMRSEFIARWLPCLGTVLCHCSDRAASAMPRCMPFHLNCVNCLHSAHRRCRRCTRARSTASQTSAGSTALRRCWWRSPRSAAAAGSSASTSTGAPDRRVWLSHSLWPLLCVLYDVKRSTLPADCKTTANRLPPGSQLTDALPRTSADPAPHQHDSLNGLQPAARFHLTTALPRTSGGEPEWDSESEANAVDLPHVHSHMGASELQQARRPPWPGQLPRQGVRGAGWASWARWFCRSLQPNMSQHSLETSSSSFTKKIVLV